MAGFTPERTGELLRMAFQILWLRPDGLPAHEIFSQISSGKWLTAYERETSPETNIPRFEEAIWLGMLPLEKAGWLEKRRGCWCITDEGRQACKRFTTPAEFNSEAKHLFDVWQLEHQALSLITEIAEEMAWKQIQRYLLGLNRHAFLSLISELFKAMDYHIAWVAPPEKTRGQIDMITYTDPLGASGHRIKAHIQHADQATMLEGIRTFISNLSPGDVGLFVSSGGFTASAREYVHTRTDVQITLLDLESFLNLWIDYYKALSDDARQRFPLKAIHFLVSQ